MSNTDFREQLVELLKKQYTTDVFGNLKTIIMEDGRQVDFIDAIVKLHEAEVEKARIHELSALNDSEIANTSLNKMQIRIRGRLKEQRAAITPKEDK